MNKYIGMLVIGLVILGAVYLLLNKSALNSDLHEKPSQAESLKENAERVVQEVVTKKPQLEIAVEDDARLQEKAVEDSCNDFRQKHPHQEAAFNAIMAEIFMSDDDASDTSVFTNMDWLSLNALANGGDKDALFFLGDGTVIKAIFGKDFYGPKDKRNAPTNAEIKAHKVDMVNLVKGRELLFRAGVRGKLGAFLSLQMNSDMATRQLIRTEPDSKEKIKRMMADLIAYNRLLSFVHQRDEPFRLMFSADARSYYDEAIQKHYKNWQPNLEPEAKTKELIELRKLADDKYESLEQKWTTEREFYGLEVHPKLLEPKLEAYLMQVSKHCWS